MKELIESMRIQLYQRLSSPFFGSFVIAWLCWNHRYIFILFASEPIATRLTLAHAMVYPDDWTLWTRGVIWPLASTLAFILLYPYPSKWLFTYWHTRQIELKRTRDEIEGETLLTKEESRKIIRETIALREKYEAQIEKLVRDIEALKTPGGALAGDETTVEQQRQRIAVLESELNRREAAEKARNADPLSGLKESVQTEALSILKQLAGAGVMNVAAIGNRLKLSPTRTQYIVETLEGRGLVSREPNEPGVYGLSPQGRMFLADRGFI